MWLGLLPFAALLALLMAIFGASILQPTTPGDAPDLPSARNHEEVRPRYPDALTSIVVLVNDACGLAESGGAVCWDIESKRKWDAPVGPFVTIWASGGPLCGELVGGGLRCWDSTGEQLVDEVPAPLSDAPPGRYKRVMMGLRYSCALSIAGEVNCWGDDEDLWPDPPAGLFAEIGRPTSLFALGGAYLQMCGLSDVGEGICWGAFGPHDATIQFLERIDETLSAIHTNSQDQCGLTSTGQSTCLSIEDNRDVRVVAIATSGLHHCAVTDSGKAVCDDAWPHYFSGATRSMIPPDPGSDPFVDIDVGTAGEGGVAYACAVTQSGRAYCWKNSENKLEQPEPPQDGYITISDGFGHTCALTTDGEIDCWGWNNFGQAIAPDGEFKAVSVGYSASCGITPKGSLVCWGSIYTDQSGHPSGLPQDVYQSVAVGYAGLCALTADGHVECKNPDYSTRSLQTPGSPFRAVSLGWDGQTCVLNKTGEALCWDASYVDRSPEVSGRGLSTISVGHSSAGCGLTLTGEVTCWTNRDAPDWQLPVGRFTSLSVGTDGSCAVSSFGEVKCWGSFTPHKLPSIGGTERDAGVRFRAVSVSNHRVCALTRGGEIRCWGDVDYERWPSDDPYGWYSGR